MIHRYTEVSADGFEPNSWADFPVGLLPEDARNSGNSLAVAWEVPVEFYWDFGDGTGVFNTGERTTVSHQYANDGVYTLNVEARNEKTASAFASKEITVKNRRPKLWGIMSAKIDSETATYELSGSVRDAQGDNLTVHWDFGDGTDSQAQGVWMENDAWKVRHQFPEARVYPIKMTVTDDRGEVRIKTYNLASAGAGSVSSDVIEDVDQDIAAGDPVSQFSANTSGSITTPFSGKILPIAGIHLSPIDQGGKCRFMFAAWDDSKLMVIAVFTDMPGLPEAEGAQFTFNSPDVRVTFHETKQDYEFARKGILNAFRATSLREEVGAAAADLTDEQRNMLTDLGGLDTSGTLQASQPRPPQTPEVSPFGLDKSQSFRTQTGILKLSFIPYDRAVAHFENFTLANYDNSSPYPTLSLAGDYSVDLEAARRNGIMLYKQCGPAQFAIEKSYPDANTQHFRLDNTWAYVNFTEQYDVETLNENTFQMVYPATGSGELVPVETRMRHGKKSARLIPIQRLWGGVRYTVRVKTGDDGVLGKNGLPLEDEDGNGWHSWDFTTRIDMIPAFAEGNNMACHVFQSVRDVPLIAGKRAVSRIYANWKENPQVLADAQVQEFTARVIIKRMIDGQETEAASDFYRFVRPDLWQSYGIDEAKADHTANVFWTPELSEQAYMRVGIEVPRVPGESHAEAYWTQCVTPIWDLQPELKVDYYVLGINSWADESVRNSFQPMVADIMAASREYALQQFPFRKVHVRNAGVLAQGGLCNEACAKGLLNENHQSTADIVIGLMPIVPGQRVGGITHFETDTNNGPGMIVMTVDDSSVNRGRWIFGIVHEFGHTLWLEHSPIVTDENRSFMTNMRDKAWESGGTPVHTQRGIEGFRINLDGNSGFNKSSIEGNAETEYADGHNYTAGPWLRSLMYPGTLPDSQAFIPRHQYLIIQDKLDEYGVGRIGRNN